MFLKCYCGMVGKLWIYCALWQGVLLYWTTMSEIFPGELCKSVGFQLKGTGMQKTCMQLNKVKTQYSQYSIYLKHQSFHEMINRNALTTFFFQKAIRLHETTAGCVQFVKQADEINCLQLTLFHNLKLQKFLIFGYVSSL